MGQMFSQTPLNKVQEEIRLLFNKQQYTSVPALSNMPLGSVYKQIDGKVPQAFHDADSTNFDLPDDAKCLGRSSNSQISTSHACTLKIEGAEFNVRGSIPFPKTSGAAKLTIGLDKKTSFFLSSPTVYELYFSRPGALIAALQQNSKFRKVLKDEMRNHKNVKFLIVTGVVKCEEGIYTMSRQSNWQAKASVEVTVSINPSAGFDFGVISGHTCSQTISPTFICGVQYEEIALREETKESKPTVKIGRAQPKRKSDDEQPEKAKRGKPKQSEEPEPSEDEQEDEDQQWSQFDEFSAGDVAADFSNLQANLESLPSSGLGKRHKSG